MIVVDLPRPLGARDHERVARAAGVGEQIVDSRIHHGAESLPAALADQSARSTMAPSSSTARPTSSFVTTWSKSPASSAWRRASSSRSPISPALSVALSRSRRSSSAKLGGSMKIVTASGREASPPWRRGSPARGSRCARRRGSRPPPRGASRSDGRRRSRRARGSRRRRPGAGTPRPRGSGSRGRPPPRAGASGSSPRRPPPGPAAPRPAF